MKKLFFVLAMTMMVGSVATAFATELNNTTKSGTTDINYSLGDKYIITIPQAFDLREPNDPVSQTVSASEVYIANGTKLQVVVSGANCHDDAWFIRDITDTPNEFEYKVSSGDMLDENLLKDEAVVLEVNAGNTEGGSSTLKFDLKNTVVKAGTYKDTLTFTSSIVPQ